MATLSVSYGGLTVSVESDDAVQLVQFGLVGCGVEHDDDAEQVQEAADETARELTRWRLQIRDFLHDLAPGVVFKLGGGDPLDCALNDIRDAFEHIRRTLKNCS